MTTQTRARTRKATKATEPPKPEPYSPEELQLAAAQENANYQQGQLAYLQNRVGVLRAEINRLQTENDELKAKTDG